MEELVRDAIDKANEAMRIANNAISIARDCMEKNAEQDASLRKVHQRITEIDSKLSAKIDDLDKRMDKIEVSLARIERNTSESNFNSRHIKIMVGIFGTIAGILFPALGALFK